MSSAEMVANARARVREIETPEGAAAPAGGDGMGCHAGAAEMEAAARMAGKSEILDQYAADYPQGPHDKPQSMCPAFGSLPADVRADVAAVLERSSLVEHAAAPGRGATLEDVLAGQRLVAFAKAPPLLDQRALLLFEVTDAIKDLPPNADANRNAEAPWWPASQVMTAQ